MPDFQGARLSAHIEKQNMINRYIRLSSFFKLEKADFAGFCTWFPRHGAELLILFLVLLLSLFSETHEDIPLFSAYECPYRLVTGKPCPGCGMTRGFIAIAHGDIGKAFTLNPLSPFLFFLVLSRFAKQFCATFFFVEPRLHLPVWVYLVILGALLTHIFARFAMLLG